MAKQRARAVWRLCAIAVFAWGHAFCGLNARSSSWPTRQRATAVETKERPAEQFSKDELATILQRYVKKGDISSVKNEFQKLADAGSAPPPAYKQVLKAIAEAGRPKDAEEWISFAEAQKVSLSGAEDMLMISRLEADDTEEAMRSLLAYVKPTLKMCRRLLQRLTDEKKDLKGATRLMSCLPAMGLQPNFAMYKSMVRSAALEGDMKMAEAWFRQLKDDKFQADDQIYVALIRGCQKAKDVEGAIRYFNLMLAAERKPPKQAYSAIILAHAEAKEVHEAVRWMERMIEANCDPDIECYESVLDAAAARGEKELRADVEDQWLARKKPDREVFKALMRVSAKHGDITSTNLWFERLRKGGYKPKPAVNEWKYLLKACEASQDKFAIDEAQKFFNRMEKAEVKPDAEAYNLMIQVMAKAGKPKYALRWRKRMADAGLVSPNSLQFDQIIKAISGDSSTISADYAADWVQFTLSAGKKPGASAWSSVIQAYLNEDRPDDARQWLEWMQQNGTAPSYDVYLKFMRSDDRKAASWHDQMEDAGIPPTAESFNLVIKSFSFVKGKQRMQKTEEWFHRMRAAGVAPDEETFAHLIAAAARSGKPEDVDKWQAELTESGLRPDNRVYFALMQRYLVERDPLGVRQILDWMVLKGNRPHRAAYNLAIRAFAEAGDMKSAEEIYRRLEAVGGRRDERTFYFLIRGHVYQKSPKSMERARAWLKEMLQMDVRPSFSIYGALIQGYAQLQQPKEAKEFLEELSLRKSWGPDRQAWLDVLRPALRCFQKAGDEEAVAKWTDFLNDKGVEINLEEEAEAEVSDDSTQKRPQNATVSRKFKKGQVSSVEREMKTLQEIQDAGNKPEIRDFNRVMKAFALSPRSRYSMARAFIEDNIMPVVEPNENTWTNLLRCNRVGDGKRGIFTIEWMSSLGVTVRRTHIEVAIRQLFDDYKAEKIDSVQLLLEKLLQALPEKSHLVTYNSIIRISAEAGLMEISMDWAKRMRSENFWVQPNTCYAVAKAHFKKGDEVSSLWWIDQAKEGDRGATAQSRLSRFVETVTRDDRSRGIIKTLFPGYGFLRIDEPPFEMIFLRSSLGKTAPKAGTRVSYNMVLDEKTGRLRADNLSPAREDPGLVDRLGNFIDRLVVDSEISKKEVPYQQIIEAYARAKHPEGAARWLQKTVDARKPSLQGYNAVIRSFAEAEEAETARSWLQRMRLEGLRPDLSSYKPVLQAFASKGDTKVAEELWQELSDSGDADDDAYCMMLQAYCAADDAEGVKVWVDRFEWEGIQLNWPSFTDLLRFYLSQGDLQKAFALSNEVALSSSFDTGPSAWLKQLEAAVKLKDGSHAEKVARSMTHFGYPVGRTGRGLLQEVLSEDSFQALSTSLQWDTEE